MASKAIGAGVYNYTFTEFEQIKQLMTNQQLSARENQVGYAGIFDMLKVGLPLAWKVGKDIIAWIRR